MKVKFLLLPRTTSKNTRGPKLKALKFKQMSGNAPLF